MSYKESSDSCDWCRTTLYDGDEVACRKCHEKLEAKVFDLEDQIETLEAELKKLRAKP